MAVRCFFPALALLFILGCGPRVPTAANGETPDLDFPVGTFSLTAPTQDGGTRTISDRDLRGKVWVAAFVFTRCAGPCPRVSATMARLNKELPADPDLRFVTFTVDPEFDTPPRLREYARNFQADLERWLFLTGDEKVIHTLLEQQFKQSAGEKPAPGTDPGEGFATHSTRLALVDRTGTVRAVYDGVANDRDPSGKDRYEAGLKRLAEKVGKLLAEK